MRLRTARGNEELPESALGGAGQELELATFEYLEQTAGEPAVPRR
jgi:hypothetical protein